MGNIFEPKKLSSSTVGILLGAGGGVVLAIMLLIIGWVAYGNPFMHDLGLSNIFTR